METKNKSPHETLKELNEKKYAEILGKYTTKISLEDLKLKHTEEYIKKPKKKKQPSILNELEFYPYAAYIKNEPRH